MIRLANTAILDSVVRVHRKLVAASAVIRSLRDSVQYARDFFPNIGSYLGCLNSACYLQRKVKKLNIAFDLFSNCNMPFASFCVASLREVPAYPSCIVHGLGNSTERG